MSNGNETLLIPLYMLEVNQTWMTPSTDSMHEILMPSCEKLYPLLSPFSLFLFKPLHPPVYSVRRFQIIYNLYHITLYATNRKEAMKDCFARVLSWLPFSSHWCDLFTQHTVNHAATGRFLMNKRGLEFTVPVWTVFPAYFPVHLYTANSVSNLTKL